jgi:leucyl aminopeptidase
MNFKTIIDNLITTPSKCLVLGIFEDNQMDETISTVDKATGEWLTHSLHNGDIDGELEQTLLLHNVQGIASQTILLVGCGKFAEYDRAKYRKAATAAINVLNKQRIPTALWALHQPLPSNVNTYRCIWDTMLLINECTYRFDKLKSEAKPPKRPLTEVTFWSRDSATCEHTAQAITHTQAVINGVNFAKDLANLPGNICTPTYLAEQSIALANESPKLQVQALEESDMRELKMGALLAVAQGSRQPPKLIILKYQGDNETTKPIVLVGKGITFDAGGISLKPGDAMDEMKFDMSGAASVLGVIKICLELKLPINLIGIIPATENLPDGNAIKPGDIVTSMSGLTIEILNTDAEGRLILSDALTYSERFQPDIVIDIATLTGACVVALGQHTSGLFANNQTLANALITAGEHSGDRAWQLPLWEEYEKQIESRFADIANIGGRAGGAITAACFLAKFTKKLQWAHLDIAGAAWLTGDKKGATGRPVPLLAQYLLQRCNLNNV